MSKRMERRLAKLAVRIGYGRPTFKRRRGFTRGPKRLRQYYSSGKYLEKARRRVLMSLLRKVVGA